MFTCNALQNAVVRSRHSFYHFQKNALTISKQLTLPNFPLVSSIRHHSARPSVEDVERISYGKRAKKRGVGSRAVPHRLNAAEREEWVLAKKKKYLALRGTGWRKERGDSPLANIYRNYCDAVGIPMIR